MSLLLRLSLLLVSFVHVNYAVSAQSSVSSSPPFRFTAVGDSKVAAHTPETALATLLFAVRSSIAFERASLARRPLVSGQVRRASSVDLRLLGGDQKSPRRSKPIIDRRSLLSSAGALAALSFVPTAHAADKPKVVVFGGSGYVGSYVVKMLLEKGCEVVSVSRQAPADQASKIKAILGANVNGVDYQQLDVLKSDLSGVLKGATSVVSCVGVAPGGANQREGNGLANIKIVNAAKAANVNNFVYISVASELSNGPIKFVFGDYVKGKAEAEEAVKKSFGSNYLLIKPGVIEGAPPGETRPPGPPGMKPALVKAVANAAVAGALGLKSGPSATIDGNKVLDSGWVF